VTLPQGILIAVVITCFSLTPTMSRAQGGIFSGPDRNFNLAVIALGSIGFSALAYYMYKNSPAERAKGYAENLGPGEWYVGAYTGLSYLPSADWQLASYPAPFQGRTAKNIVYQPGILGGVKFGRYFDAYPWLGLEVETNFSRNNLKGNQGRITPSVPGAPKNALGGSDWFMIWDTQVNLLARYGFYKDKEVNFGRLQPYVGIGPGVEIIYGKYDSAKNLAIEALAGIRYMFTQNVGIFSEYKFSYQFDVEYQNVLIGKNRPEGTMQFDVPHHRFTLGVSYHFKNLYGN
jgi:opacity protein-like surface antigen